MSHAEQLAFLSAVVEANRILVNAGSVLEIGSYDVNGSVRGLFSTSGRYVGVDLCEGPGVDVVSFGHEVDLPEQLFDVTVSAECFEHDPHWLQTFTRMVELTRPGGVVTFTCAGTGRPEHGTRRTDFIESPGTQAVGLDYYRNLTREDFVRAYPFADRFETWQFWSCRRSFDLYFAGVVACDAGGSAIGRLPSEADVRAIDRMMSFPERVVRMPLRAVQRRAGSEASYQDAIVGYWRGVQRLRQVGFRSRIKGIGAARAKR